MEASDRAREKNSSVGDSLICQQKMDLMSERSNERDDGFAQKVQLMERSNERDSSIDGFSHSAKRKRTVLTLKDKLDIIELVKNGSTRSDLAEKYDIGLSTITDICKREIEFRDFANTVDPSRRTMRKSDHDEMDDALYMWYQLMRLGGNHVTGVMLCDKAKVFNRKLNGDPMFKASHGWLQRFKLRRGIQLEVHKKEQGQEDPTLVGPIPDDDEIIKRCLAAGAVKTEARSTAADAGEADVAHDAYLDSSTGFIRRKKKKRRVIKSEETTETVEETVEEKPRRLRRDTDSLEEMKKRKLALEIEQLELRNHLCRIEIFQAERQNCLEPSLYTESFYKHSQVRMHEVYLNPETPQ